MCCCFQLGYLNDHLFGKELFVRFTVRVFRELLSNFVCVILSLLVLGVGSVCINFCLSIYFLYLFLTF